jgi:hypothetical protein
MKTCGFAIRGLAHLRNLRIYDRGMSPKNLRICNFRISHEIFDLQTDTPKKLADYESEVRSGICGFAIC